MTDSHCTLPDGRELAYTDVGDPRGACVFFFHGAPLTRLHLVWMEGRFAAAGLRVVSPDRPGYGRSSPQPGRSMSDWPGDVTAVADALGVDRFLVAAHSSGGPYAVACAATLPARVAGAIVVAGVTDMSWTPAWEGYLEDERQIMRAPDEAAAVEWCRTHYGPDGNRFLAAPFEFPPPDAAALRDDPAMAASLEAAMREAFRQGVVGYAQDVFVQGRPWPFDPGAIAVPVAVVHGDADTLVPLAQSRHTAEVIPTATFKVLPGHGHLTILSELPALASALARPAA